MYFVIFNSIYLQKNATKTNNKSRNDCVFFHLQLWHTIRNPFFLEKQNHFFCCLAMGGFVVHTIISVQQREGCLFKFYREPPLQHQHVRGCKEIRNFTKAYIFSSNAASYFFHRSAKTSTNRGGALLSILYPQANVKKEARREILQQSYKRKRGVDQKKILVLLHIVFYATNISYLLKRVQKSQNFTRFDSSSVI